MDARPTESAPALPSLPPLASTLRCTSASAEPPPASAGPALPHTSSATSLVTSATTTTADEPPPQQQQSNDQLSSILFGIPDRAATASAPPDLEISSRSLFAFKAGYSGIFSDIRTDDYYESFYNENPERLNLPPPLPTDSRYSHEDDQLQRQPSGRRPPAPPSNQSIPIPRRPSPRPIGSRINTEHSPAPSPPSQTNSSTADVEQQVDDTRQVSAASSAVQIHQQQQLRYMAQHQQQQQQQQRQHVPVQDTVGPLWASLNQLTLDEIDGNNGTLSPRRLYPQAYPPSSSGLNYLYATQPGSPLEPQPTLFESSPPPAPQQQRWLDGIYDPTPQDYGGYRGGGGGREDMDIRAAYSARALYPLQSHQQQQRGRRGGGNSGRSRGHNNSPFNYLYASRAAASVVVPPPNSSNYLDAQAAAAAAAAAAAVYKNGGVHINGTGPFGGGSGRGMRNNGGKGNRGMKMNDHHRDSYRGGNGGGMRNDYRDSEDGGSGGGSRGNGLVSNNKLSSFNDIIGRAEELARDQHGCRFLQTKLEEGNAMYINSIFEECYEKFVDLMTDPFGNYLCQKLFEHCNDAQRLALVERCAPAFPRVSTNMHGTRAVQRMVECLSTPRQVEAVCKALAPAAVALMKDINGNHVIQRCLHRMDPAHNQFVYDAVASHCFELATHRHGCCVMQRCMDYASPAQRNQLAKQINKNALPLVQNAFGNYVVQYVLGLNDPSYTAEIIRRLRGHVAELSMQKFSSNVVEKGLLQGARDLRQELIFELIEDEDTMRRLLHDAYGNYVIQRALQVAESPQLEHICEAIRPHLNSLRQSPYGKRIQAKIQKRMPKCLPASIASN